jgi:hypothetical protein
MKYLIPFVALILIGCNGGLEASESDQELMRDEVRDYLFLGDSVEVATNVVDTILVEELDGMLATIEDNLFNIQLDIDTLGSMIDEESYANLEFEKGLHLYPESADLKMAPRNLKVARYQIKMAELKAVKLGFQQTKRVMLHLRRDQLNTIAGYEIIANYLIQDETVELAFIMNANFEIVD